MTGAFEELSNENKRLQTQIQQNERKFEEMEKAYDIKFEALEAKLEEVEARLKPESQHADEEELNLQLPDPSVEFHRSPSLSSNSSKD